MSAFKSVENGSAALVGEIDGQYHAEKIF